MSFFVLSSGSSISHSYFYNSLITLINNIPKIIVDESILKKVENTTINKKNFTKIILTFKGKTPQNLGFDFNYLDENHVTIYEILVDPFTYFPFSILQKNNRNVDFIKTTFFNYKIEIATPEDKTWQISTFKPNFKAIKSPELDQPIIDIIAPNFILTDFASNKKVSLKDYQGKVVLLDFWFKNCSPCIKDVPVLNQLNEKFKNDNFQLISINPIDNDKNIAFFKKKYAVNYMILKDKNNVAKDYFVNGYPTKFLINKKGKIVYSSDDVETTNIDIAKLIEEELLKN